MARIVMTTFGSYGDLFPYLAVGKELRRRGHEPVLAAAAEYGDQAQRAGLEFSVTRPDASLDNRELLTRIMDPKRGGEILIKEVLVPSLRDSYADLEQATVGADLLVSHVLTYAAPILAEKTGMRWASTVLSPMMFCSAYEPPAFAPLPWVAAMRPLGAGINAVLLRMLKRVAHRWSEPIREFRREQGLPPGGDPFWEGQHSAYAVLAMFSPIFGRPQPDWPPHTTACGFPFYDEAYADDDSELDAFLTAGEPPIAFTLGSAAVQAVGSFYDEALRAVRQTGQRAVLVAGPHAEKLHAAPEYVHVVRSAPFHHLFPHCSVVVHSGGIGTTAQALRAGVRQVVVPFSHDQFDNANRVERIGCGVRLRRRPTAAALAAAIAKVLAWEGNETTAVAEIVRAENGVAAACDVLEELLSRPR